MKGCLMSDVFAVWSQNVIPGLLAQLAGSAGEHPDVTKRSSKSISEPPEQQTRSEKLFVHDRHFGNTSETEEEKEMSQILAKTQM